MRGLNYFVTSLRHLSLKREFFSTPALKNGATVIVSTLITFLVCEVAVRALKAPTDRGGDFIGNAKAPYLFDRELGHIPTPQHFETAVYNWTVRSDSTRNVPDGLPDGPAILAVGDSFTFSLEVHDEDAWPAQLERLSDKRVINAGVPGYGVDQMVLRAEKILADSRDVDTVILCVFGDDINRNEFSYIWAQKPYFVLSGDGLELRGVPVRRGAPAKRQLYTMLTYSRLADLVLRRLSPNWWLVERPAVRVHHDGLEISERLMTRLDEELKRTGKRLIFVPLIAWPNEMDSLRALTRFAEESKIETLDLNSELAPMIETDSHRWLATQGHLNVRGNRWVAEKLQPLVRR